MRLPRHCKSQDQLKPSTHFWTLYDSRRILINTDTMKGLIQFVAVGISLGFIFSVIGCFKTPSVGMIVMTILVGVVAFGLWKVATNWK